MSPKVAERNKALPESTSISSSFEIKSSSCPANKSFEIASRGSLIRKNIQALEASTLKPKKPEDAIPDIVLINILNKFVFCLFVLFIMFLNLFSLFIFPYILQTPLTIDN